MNPVPIRIPAPANFSFDECRWFLDRNFDDCMHRMENGHIIKAILVDNAPVLIRVSSYEKTLHVTILQGKASKTIQQKIIAWVEEWLDMKRDITPFYQLLRAHKSLAWMADSFAGLRLISIPDLFEALCWSITGQQINLSFAYKLKRRLVEKYGIALETGDEIHHLFPTAQALSAATVDELRALQYSTSKAQYIISTAKAFAEGDISKEKLLSLPDFAARQSALTALKGIGIWTANYVLMKSLREPTGIPHGDAGLYKALITHGIISDKTDKHRITELFRQFEGWESYLVCYLWRSLSVQ